MKIKITDKEIRLMHHNRETKEGHSEIMCKIMPESATGKDIFSTLDEFLGDCDTHKFNFKGEYLEFSTVDEEDKEALVSFACAY